MKSLKRNSDHQQNMMFPELKQFDEFIRAEISMFFVTLDVNGENIFNVFETNQSFQYL